MKSIVFTGNNHQEICDILLSFITKHYGQIIMTWKDDGRISYPTHRMLFNDDFSYFLTEVFDKEKKCVNKIIQFRTGPEGYTLCGKDSIYVNKGETIVIEDGKITIVSDCPNDIDTDRVLSLNIVEPVTTG